MVSCTPKAEPIQKISIPDLDPALLLPDQGAMPEGVILSTTSTTFEKRDVLKPYKFIWKQIEDATTERGGINIYTYESPLDMKHSYQTEQESNKSISDKTYPDLTAGEVSQVTSYIIGSDQVNDLVFYRCNVLVTVRYLASDTTDLMAIGSAIDSAIQKWVCE
jgi:hypothetical protein